MHTGEDTSEMQVDEYLWPLTGELTPVDWVSLAEELRMRERLAEIMAHVRAMHIEPTLRQLGAQGSAVRRRVAGEAVIAGPLDGAPWERTLRGSVPRALREEWDQLAQRLREFERRRNAPRRSPLSLGR
jgi:hypothetical protein